MIRNQAMKSSRRSFIKTAAVGTAGLAGLTALETGTAKTDQIKWDYEAGVVVLGTGGSGLMTAITAKDQGADVLILEKAPEAHAGGNTRVSGQGYWCPSDYDKSVAYQKAMSDGYPIPDDVTKVFHEHSIHVTEWLTKMGADMRTIPTQGEYPEFPGGAQNVCWSKLGNGFQRLWILLKENALKRNVRVQYEMPAVELIRDVKTGEVRGVVAESHGKKVYVKAKKAVVLCTGGFENNQEMIRDYLGMPCTWTTRPARTLILRLLARTGLSAILLLLRETAGSGSPRMQRDSPTRPTAQSTAKYLFTASTSPSLLHCPYTSSSMRP
jgi:choline dehydrogenase-like flavoprotein